MKWNQAKEQLLKDPATREAYESIDLGFEIGKMITDARITRKMTQSALAEKVGTKQPSIARIESGSTLPSLSFLEKIAEALDTKLLPPRFDMLVAHHSVVVRREYSYEITDSYRLVSGTIGQTRTTASTLQEYNPTLGGTLYGPITS